MVVLRTEIVRALPTAGLPLPVPGHEQCVTTAPVGAAIGEPSDDIELDPRGNASAVWTTADAHGSD